MYEIESIIFDFLKDDPSFLKYQLKLNQADEEKKREMNDFIYNYNKTCDEKFSILRNINDDKLLFIRSNDVIPSKNPVNDSEEIFNDIQINRELNHFEFYSGKQKNIKEEEEIKKMLENDDQASFLLESLLTCDSFRKNESLNKISNFQSFVSLRKLKEKEHNLQTKDLRLASSTYYTEFSPEHKPKILTTNKCKNLIVVLIETNIFIQIFKIPVM